MNIALSGNSFTGKNKRALLWLAVGLVVLAALFVGSKLLTKKSNVSAPPMATTATVSSGSTASGPVRVSHPSQSGPAPNYTRNPFATAKS